MLSDFVTNRQWKRVLFRKESFRRKTSSFIENDFSAKKPFPAIYINV